MEIVKDIVGDNAALQLVAIAIGSAIAFLIGLKTDRVDMSDISMSDFQ